MQSREIQSMLNMVILCHQTKPANSVCKRERKAFFTDLQQHPSRQLMGPPGGLSKPRNSPARTSP